MLDKYKSSIVLSFVKIGDDGKDKIARVTLANVRQDLSTAEIIQVAQAFGSLITHTLQDVELVTYSYVRS